MLGLHDVVHWEGKKIPIASYGQQKVAYIYIYIYIYMGESFIKPLQAKKYTTIALDAAVDNHIYCWHD
jgi:hypothetical protein